MTNIKLRHIVGSGHLHGLSAPGLNLDIALEPDALHRETQRRLSLSTGVSSGDHTQPLIIERGYTATGQIEQLSLTSPNSAGEQHYQYDALGRILFRSQQAQGQTRPTIAYNYDAAGRLVGSQHGHDAHRYPVNAAGNRSAAPNATNQLAELNGTRYRYDGAGNLIHREHQNGERLTLGYDGANRLVTLTRTAANGQATHANYRYDALGRRIDKTVHHPNGTTATTHYGWDGDRIVREETNNQRTTVIYEPGSFVPMLRIDQGQESDEQHLSTYITDALGTPLQLLTPNGKPRWLAEPDDWAAVKNQRAVPNVTQPIRFQGQWHDEESGLYYNRHRYYDPEQGRYISQDPIGLNGGNNLYQYASSPITEVDPLGLRGVYGLGGGPYSQSNTVSRSIPNRGSKTAATGADVGGEVFGGVFGTSLSTGGQVDSNGNFCAVTTGCTKFGLGAYAGGGVDFGGSVNDEALKTGVTETWGPFVRGGAGLAAGASGSFGEGSAGGARGFIGKGVGGALGVQFCRISTICMGDGE